MPKHDGADPTPAPANSTFGERRRAREAAGNPKPPTRRRALRAGIDAETDFTISYSTTTGGNRVHTIRTS